MNIRKFSDITILTTLSAKFSLSHFVEFIRIKDYLKNNKFKYYKTMFLSV